MLTFGSLFAGIGGFDLGFERAGMACKWQVEINPYAQRVLAKHWPNVRRHDDVRTWPQPDAERVDVICGGFPCTDISNAGGMDGIDAGEHSGLWREYARIIRELRPKFAVVENVSAILSGGLGRVLGDLAASGYDAEWDCLPASAFGAPIGRERTFIVAYPDSFRRQRRWSYPPPCWTWQSGARVESERLRSAGVRLSVYPPGPIGVASRLPGDVDRLGCLGNVVVPQIAEWIGRRVVNLSLESHTA